MLEQILNALRINVQQNIIAPRLTEHLVRAYLKLTLDDQVTVLVMFERTVYLGLDMPCQKTTLFKIEREVFKGLWWDENDGKYWYAPLNAENALNVFDESEPYIYSYVVDGFAPSIRDMYRARKGIINWVLPPKQPQDK